MVPVVRSVWAFARDVNARVQANTPAAKCYSLCADRWPGPDPNAGRCSCATIFDLVCGVSFIAAPQRSIQKHIVAPGRIRRGVAWDKIIGPIVSQWTLRAARLHYCRGD